MSNVNSWMLATHPFLRGMRADYLATLSLAATDVRIEAGRRLFEEGGSATRFWLIRSGGINLDLYVPGEERAVIESIGMGELRPLAKPVTVRRALWPAASRGGPLGPAGRRIPSR